MPAGQTLASEAPRLLATSWTSAGNALPEVADGRSPFALEDRVIALSRAGWRGIGVLHADLRAFLERNSLDSLGWLLADHGLDRLELEFLTDWWAEGERGRAAQRVKHELFEAAAALSVPFIKVLPDLSGQGVDEGEFRDSFAELAEEAAASGTRIAIENLPFASHMRTVRETLDLVTAVGHPAAGLTLDIWHVRRSGTSDEAIRRIPADRIFVVELDDAAAASEGDPYRDTMDRRLLPGEGDLDVPSFIAAVQDTGYTGYWGVEVISERHRRRTLHDAVTDAYRCTMRCFDEARARQTGAQPAVRRESP